MELSQYFLTENADSPALISKFMSKLRPAILDKIAEHRFNTLMDYYAFTQLVEANIKSRNAEHARPRNPGNNRKMTQRGSSGWKALGQVAYRPAEDDSAPMDVFTMATRVIVRRTAHFANSSLLQHLMGFLSNGSHSSSASFQSPLRPSHSCQ